MKIYYTAIGHLQLKRIGIGHQVPVILVNGNEYPLDPQEMVLWSRLCWHILNNEQLKIQYDAISNSIPASRRTFEEGLNRLLTRGLVISGTGDTDSDALYELLGSVFIVPISTNWVLRIFSFVKMLLTGRAPFRSAKVLLQRDRPSAQEQRILILARKIPLSTAEVVKCFEQNIDGLNGMDQLLSTLYDDACTTCDNIADFMYSAKSRAAVTMAVANLYLRKQIILERISPV